MLSTTTAPTRRRSSTAGSCAIRDTTCTSPRRARHGSTWSNAGSRRSPTNSCDAACIAAHASWRRPSVGILRSRTNALGHSCGPRRPMKSPRASPDFVIESLTQDTSHLLHSLQQSFAGSFGASRRCWGQARSKRAGWIVRLNGFSTKPSISSVTTPRSASSPASPRITGVCPSPCGRVM